MVMNNILEDYKSQEDLFEEYLEYLFVTGQLDLKADDDDEQKLILTNKNTSDKNE